MKGVSLASAGSLATARTACRLAACNAPKHTQSVGHPPNLPAALVEELGRILGEALVQQFQQDTGALGACPAGIHHTPKGERE